MPTQIPRSRTMRNWKTRRVSEALGTRDQWHRLWLLKTRRCVALAVEVGGE